VDQRTREKKGTHAIKLERYPRNPILSPNPDHACESGVTTNLGAWYEEETGTVYLLYRAAGAEPEHKMYLGLATSRDGIRFERQSDRPVLGPSDNGFDAGCVRF
jgi:hypothetical protein